MKDKTTIEPLTVIEKMRHDIRIALLTQKHSLLGLLKESHAVLTDSALWTGETAAESKERREVSIRIKGLLNYLADHESDL